MNDNLPKYPVELIYIPDSDGRGYLTQPTPKARRVPERRQPYVYDDSVAYDNGAEYGAEYDKRIENGGDIHDSVMYSVIYDVDIVRGDSAFPIPKYRREG